MMNKYTIGSLVKFRGREWILMPPRETDTLCLRPLTGREEDVCGVYLPLERANIQPTKFPLPTVGDIGDFESARLLRNAARLLLRHGAGPFRSMGHLSFRPRPYQLVPLLMGLRLRPIRMLLADDVGIGKTIEAGLIARELLDRGEVNRFTILCPPYLCDQWQKELSEKFNIDAKIVRTNTLAKLERDLPRSNLSIFEYYPYLVISIDYVKSQRRKDAFLLHAPNLVIIDEAHGCARPPGQLVTQQQRHNLITDLTKDESKNILLVTATPHSGIEESFLSLLGFIRTSFEEFDLQNLKPEERTELAKHFIQRRRADVKEWMGTKTFFPERESLEVSFRLSPQYAKFFKDIHRFTCELVASGEKEKGFHRRVRYWAALALLRCVMSSPAAANAALISRLGDTSEDESLNDLDYSPYVLDPIDREYSEDVVPSRIVKDTETLLRDSERRKLREFSRRTEGLKGENDSKIKKTTEELRDLLNHGFKPIIYCRFIASSDYVAQELQKRLKPDFPDIHVISVTGLVSDEEREIRIKELCDLPKRVKRVLVATDCLSEGINLQEGFNAVIHYDLPWNPNRLEQREGRVDRFGQNSKIVKTILLYGADNPIDGAVLDVLLRKAKHIHKTLGITVPIPTNSESLMETVMKALFLYGVDDHQLGLFDEEMPVKEIHHQWERAAERERKSRTLFAQHAIKPNEITKELKLVDTILGNQNDVEEFIKSICQRLGSPLSTVKRHWKVSLANLPQTICSRLPIDGEMQISFDYPVPERVTYVSRNHPLTNTLAEYLFNTAFQEGGNREIAARCGVIRSRDVNQIITLLLLRYRFLIQIGQNESSSIAEKCFVTGFEGTIRSEKWFEVEKAERLFNQVVPSSIVSDNDRKHWAGLILNDFELTKQKLEKIAEDQAQEIMQSYERVRKAIKGKKASVKPLLPGDILAISIILPQPGD